jgi:hypothetical protein
MLDRVMRGTRLVALGVVCCLSGCGGSSPPAEAPDPVLAEPEPEPEPAPELEEPAETAPTESAGAEPEFNEGMSVDEAINAVPQGSERVNVDPDELGKPLTDMKVYEPCKAKPNEHAKIRVAIWDGRAVGIDVETTPKNDKLAECIKEQIRALSWKDKVRSLNTVEFAF